MLIRGEVALAVGAATTTNRLADSSKRNVKAGILRVYAVRSATASSTMTVNLKINGFSLGSEANGATIPFVGATTSLSRQAHLVIEQVVGAGELALYFTDTVAASTVDYFVEIHEFA